MYKITSNTSCALCRLLFLHKFRFENHLNSLTFNFISLGTFPTWITYLHVKTYSIIVGNIMLIRQTHWFTQLEYGDHTHSNSQGKHCWNFSFSYLRFRFVAYSRWGFITIHVKHKFGFPCMLVKSEFGS